LVGSSGDRYCRRASSSQKEAKEESKECLNSSDCRHQSVARRLPTRPSRRRPAQQVYDALERRAERPREYCPVIDQTGTFPCFSMGSVSSGDNLISQLSWRTIDVSPIVVQKQHTGFESPYGGWAAIAHALTAFRKS
jgi:hypothetical protein